MDIDEVTQGITTSFGGCRRWSGGCCLLLLLFGTIFCGFLFWLFVPDRTDAAVSEQPLAVWLLIDNSNSMFEMGGVGSDPDLLRLDAARLFLSYLGVDEFGWIHQAGVIFFGSTAETTVPLTPLTNDDTRAQLFAQIANPTRMGWTDHLAALELGQSQLTLLDANQHPVIILLTDGKPEWSQTPDEAQQAAYMTALQNKGAELAGAGVSLFIVLLANEATDADPELMDVWLPFWQSLSQATPAGHFYVARTADVLPDIYHDIVVALTNRESAGIVVNTMVTDTTQTSLDVPPGLSQMTLVIGKTSPTQTVRIETPQNQFLTEDQIGVRQSGGNAQSREEVWVIEHPRPGNWTLYLEGSGQIHVWQDFVTAPLPPASPTPIPTRLSALVPVVVESTAILADDRFANSTPTAIETRPVIQMAVSTVPPDQPVILTPNRPGTQILGLLTALLLCGAALFYLYRRRYQKRPLVTGMLRLFGAARTAGGQTVIDLDGLSRPALTLGQAPADVPLPGATAQAVIYPGACLTADIYEMRLSAKGDLWVNGIPLTGEMTLTDAAVINFGGIEVRYENLHLRRTERELQEMGS